MVSVIDLMKWYMCIHYVTFLSPSHPQTQSAKPIARRDAVTTDLASISPDHMTVDASNGKLLSSAGALQDDEATARVVYQMLQDTNSLLTASATYSEKDAFRSITVSFTNYQVCVTTANDRIYVVRKLK
jgi:hypothetical protein